MRRCIPPGGVAKAQKYLDIPALWRLARQAPQRLKMQIYFCANPKKKCIHNPIDMPQSHTVGFRTATGKGAHRSGDRHRH
jgi:hypothetical protein